MSVEPQSERDENRVVIFDTTLRDGEQCPGATMTFEEKLEVADLLDAMGVDIIEAGFPIASEGDFEAVAEIARRTKNAVVAGLARAIPKDIDRCGEAVRHAKRLADQVHAPWTALFVETAGSHRASDKMKAEVVEASTGGCNGRVCRNVYPLAGLLARGYAPVRFKAFADDQMVVSTNAYQDTGPTGRAKKQGSQKR